MILDFAPNFGKFNDYQLQRIQEYFYKGKKKPKEYGKGKCFFGNLQRNSLEAWNLFGGKKIH